MTRASGTSSPVSYRCAMGSSGIRRKRRKHLPKVRSSEETPPGTIPLGRDPGLGPWGPMGGIQAYGKIARAFVRGTPRQQRAAGVFLLVLALPAIVGLIIYAVSAARW
jgi:hypothetical protein